MRAWLLKISGKRTAALIGAIAYMAAPYHLFDTYTRGAFAEITAYAVLPVVMLALASPSKGRAGACPAGVGLRSTPAVAPAERAAVLDHSDPGLRALHHARARSLLCAVGGVLGIGLAAIYLLPAVELQPWISSHELWTSFYRASNWFVMAPERWVDPDTMRVIGSIVLATALLAAGLCLALLQLPDDQGGASWASGCAGPRLSDPDRGPAAVVLGSAAGRQGAVPLAPADGRRVRLADRALPGAAWRAPPGRRLCLRRGGNRPPVPGTMLIVTDACSTHQVHLASHTWGRGRHDVKESQPADYKLHGSRYAALSARAARGHAGDRLRADRRRRLRPQQSSLSAPLRLIVHHTISRPRVTLRRFFSPASQPRCRPAAEPASQALSLRTFRRPPQPSHGSITWGLHDRALG